MTPSPPKAAAKARKEAPEKEEPAEEAFARAVRGRALKLGANEWIQNARQVTQQSTWADNLAAAASHTGYYVAQPVAGTQSYTASALINR